MVKSSFPETYIVHPVKRTYWPLRAPYIFMLKTVIYTRAFSCVLFGHFSATDLPTLNSRCVERRCVQRSIPVDPQQR